MEFDKNKIDQKLLFMDTCLNKLKKLRTFDKDVFIDDFTKVDSAKYLLQYYFIKSVCFILIFEQTSSYRV